MHRKLLGNDPFERGAAPRPDAAQLAALAEQRRADGGEPEGAEVDDLARRPPSPAAAATAAPPSPAAAARKATPRRTAEPIGPTQQAARVLLDTVGERLRHFLENRLPQLVSGVAKSSFDALGLATTPIPVPEVDPFGRSAEFVAEWQPVMARILHSYFRAELSGFEKLPPTGPALLVCNHSGVLPYDELLLKVAAGEALTAVGNPREVRPLSEDFLINAPFAGSWINRFGLVRASQDNAERLLRSGHLVAVFPEGGQGIGKLFRHRYQLQRFGRGGFVRLALRTQVPIFPVALLGGEEAQPVMARLRLPKPLLPTHLPITPTFPLLGPVGLLPLPARWRLEVGDPIVLPHPPEAADDRTLIAQLTEEIRQQLQRMLAAAVAQRPSAYF